MARAVREFALPPVLVCRLCGRVEGMIFALWRKSFHRGVTRARDGSLVFVVDETRSLWRGLKARRPNASAAARPDRPVAFRTFPSRRASAWPSPGLGRR